MGQHHRRFTVEVLDGARTVFRRTTNTRSHAERLGLSAAFEVLSQDDLRTAKAIAASLLRGES